LSPSPGPDRSVLASRSPVPTVRHRARSGGHPDLHDLLPGRPARESALATPNRTPAAGRALPLTPTKRLSRARLSPGSRHRFTRLLLLLTPRSPDAAGAEPSSAPARTTLAPSAPRATDKRTKTTWAPAGAGAQVPDGAISGSRTVIPRGASAARPPAWPRARASWPHRRTRQPDPPAARSPARVPCR
jgi:hypothetical protein